MRQVAVGVVLAALVAACTTTGEDAGPPELATVTPGTLTACIAPAPDLVELDAQDWDGYDVAVLEALVEQLDVQLTLVETPFDDIVTGVAFSQGRCDVAAGGVVDRPSLGEVVDRSVPYRTVHRLVVALEDRGLVDPADLQGALGLEEAGPAADVLDAVPGVTPVPFPSQTDLAGALREGVVDKALVTVPGRAALEEALGRHLPLRSAVPTDDRTVLLLPLGGPEDVAEAVDMALGDLAERGVLDTLRDRWIRG